MIALGITAILVALVAVQMPVTGWYVTIIAALLAAFSHGRAWMLGGAAILLNILNLLLMSPFLTMTVKSGFAQGDYIPLLRLAGLLIIQLQAAGVLYLLQRRTMAREAATNR